VANPIVYLITEDPPRRGDSPEVARIKASAAAEDFCARLRARGENVRLVPPPVRGWTDETGGAA
jgi:hypothetical protein